MRFIWAEEKKLQRVDKWMKMIFTDESRIYIDKGDDAGTFIQCHSNET